MIIDMHTHVAGGFSEKFAHEWTHDTHFGCMPAWFKEGKERWTKDDLTRFWADRYVEEMDQKGIDKAVTWGIVMRPYDCRSTVEEVAAIAKRAPDRIIPFHCADPHAGKPGVQDLERAVTEFGFRGMKVFPSYNWIDPDDEKIFPLYEKCAQLGIPAVVHTGFTFNHRAWLRHHHPASLDPVCARFPELTVVIAHFGFQFVEEAITLMLKYRNLYADLAWFLLYPIEFVARALVWAKHFGLIERVMYRSDYPLSDPKTEGIERLSEVQAYQKRHELEPSLTDEDLALVLGGNARRLLALG